MRVAANFRIAAMMHLGCAWCFCCLIVSQAIAQTPRPVDPREFGLNIPPGPVRAGNDEAIATADDDGSPVVAKLLVDVGDYRIVMLPDGRLVPRPMQAATLTERKFEPITKDALSSQLLAQEFSGFKTNQTRHYLNVYNTSEEFALATSRIMETMFPGVANYAKAQKIEIAEPDVPLVVVMFRTEDEFQRYQRMPTGVVAYYNILDNRVVMYEESRLKSVKPELAIQQSIATIAHEGAHQILHNIGVQKRLSRWPMWLSEGIAEFFAPTTFGSRLKWKGAGQVNDMRMFELEMYLKSRESDQPDGHMIEQTVIASRLTSTGYASAWSLTHYLAKIKRVNFNDYVREVSQLGPLETIGETVAPGVVPENLELFHKHFGDDLGDLNKRLVLHLKKLPYSDPFAEWPHFVATVAVPDGRRAKRDANIFHSADMASKWIEEALETVDAQQRSAAATDVRVFANRTIATQYARQWLGQ
ncbi:MAG TPA: DUF1570 domain-containing protein [Pirellulaceae bacterium]|nr:DUF1570 domain-containing protein [Planctomycetales bacterium]MCB9938240.1 DUF1570 domain-containing protein [Planctomycetaceae bacterium]HRX78713.1 DUF1570 domain-containing protein [Pirellulaceae bacterium]